MADEKKEKQKQNTDGLKKYQKERHEAARYKCHEAIKLLIRERKPITFKTVADAANVSTQWLYKQTDLTERIRYLRDNNRPKIAIPKRERASDDSRNSIIGALRLRIKKLEREVRELREQNEIAYGQIAVHRDQINSNTNANVSR